MVYSFLADFIAGWVGGCASVIVGYPYDTVKVRQQNFSASFIIAVRETIKYEGVLGLYKGMSAPLVSYGPSNSLFFGSFGFTMRVINGSGPDDPSHMHHRRKYFINLFYAGCFAGFCQVIVMCPFDVVKISIQTSTEGKSNVVKSYNLVKYTGTIDAFRTIFKFYGIKGLYRGLVPMLIRDIPTSGLYIMVYEGLLPNDRNDVKWYHKVWGGGWAGLASICPVLPIDVVKTRIQADDLLTPQYRGTKDCIMKLYKDKGLRIFWTGLPVITARAFPAHAVLFLGYEACMDFLGATVM